MLRLVIAILALLGYGGAAHAQVRPYEPSDGFISGVSAPATTALASCITPLDTDVLGEVAELGCTVVDSTRLSPPAGRPIWMLKYLRRAAFRYDTFVDTLAIDELALVRLDDTGAAVEPVWHTARERTYEFLERVESVDLGTRSLVSYLTCLNGTGGCMQHFLLGRDTWAVVEQPYLDELEELLPPSWSLHKGRLIDLATLSGVQPIARPDDANCCPSGVIEFRVELRGSALHLVSATVVTDA